MMHPEPPRIDQETLDAIYEQATTYAVEQGQDVERGGAYASWYCDTQQMTGRPVDQWAPHGDVYAAWQREMAEYYVRSSRSLAGHGHHEDAAHDRDRAILFAGRELVEQLDREADATQP